MHASLTYSTQHGSRFFRKECVRGYCFGFNGKEKVDEVYGDANAYDFGARLYDPRLGRWLAVDPLAAKFPFTSPYSSMNNNPILNIDIDGREWVNAHTAEVQRLETDLLKNPDSKKLQRQLNVERQKEALVNKYINDIKENDFALYTYIDQMKVSANGKEKNIKVYVTSDPSPFSSSGQSASVSTPLKYTEDPNVSFNGKEVIAPMSMRFGHLSFDVVIYGEYDWGDESLANEIGDIMYHMEYNKESREGKSSSEYFKPGGGGIDGYLRDPATQYSNKVEETYEQRKKDGSGKNKDNNPYPLEKNK